MVLLAGEIFYIYVSDNAALIYLYTMQNHDIKKYFVYLADPTAPLPPKETIGTMPHYFERDDVLYCSC